MASTFRILVSSDNHTGYAEDKPIIGDDSFDGFEEVLQHAKNKDADFVLLGGDLFHKSEPDRSTVHRVTTMLRDYVFGDREIPFSFISEPDDVFPNSTFKRVNFEDENINIAMPIFTIHGNHDDFSGKGLLALDNFHDSGYLNLFGKFTNVEHIEVKPVLLQKGSTKIALYGIGHQRDDRLCRAFNLNKVKFYYPEDLKDWFKILVVHQNRPPRSQVRSTGSYLPADKIPDFINLVVWGHEHACCVEDVDLTAKDPTYILQPGSSVATSLCPDESVPKAIALLEVTGTSVIINKIPLERSRQIVYDILDLGKTYPHFRSAKTKVRADKNMEDEEYIHKKLKKMLKEANEQRGPHQPHLPRMRLKVLYTGGWVNIPPVKPAKICEIYKDKVANHSELVKVHIVRPEREKQEEGEPVELKNLTDTTTVFDLLRESIKQRASDGLGLLQLDGMEQMVKEQCLSAKTKSITKKDALKSLVEKQTDNYLGKIHSYGMKQFGAHPTASEIKGFVKYAVSHMITSNQKAFTNPDELTEDIDMNVSAEHIAAFTQNDENQKVEAAEEKPVSKRRATATKPRVAAKTTRSKRSSDVVADSMDDVVTLDDD